MLCVTGLACTDQWFLHYNVGKENPLKLTVKLQWLKNGVKLVLLYSDGIKKAALKWGPYSLQAINEVKKIDSILKYLMEKSRLLNVNIVLTSDGGVTDLKWDMWRVV